MLADLVQQRWMRFYGSSADVLGVAVDANQRRHPRGTPAAGAGKTVRVFNAKVGCFEAIDSHGGCRLVISREVIYNEMMIRGKPTDAIS